MRDLREKRRLIEAGHLKAWRRQGRGSFHLENVHLTHTLLGAALRMTGLMNRGRRNALDPRVRTVELELPDLPSSLSGFRILHLSDMHVDATAGLAAAVCSRLEGMEADLCVLTGDYRYEIEGSCAPVYPLMEKILGCVQATHGVLGVLGNHDFSEIVPRLERTGIRFLMNGSVEIRRGNASLWVAGVDDPHYYGCDNLPEALSRVPQDAFKILLAHSPELYREAADRGVNLYLCGHTHGGQICLPGGAPILVNAKCPRRLARGTWQHGRMLGYTNAGVGSSLLPVRFNCPPEIALLELRTPRVPL